MSGREAEIRSAIRAHLDAVARLEGELDALPGEAGAAVAVAPEPARAAELRQLGIGSWWRRDGAEGVVLRQLPQQRTTIVEVRARHDGDPRRDYWSDRCAVEVLAERPAGFPEVRLR